MSAVSPSRPDVVHFMTRASHALQTTLPSPKDVFHFGDNPSTTNKLLRLAILNLKSATTSWPVPEPMHWDVGDLSVILDGDDRPAALMRTLSLHRCLFKDVEESFAVCEAEGTLEEYRAGHFEFYRRTEGKVGRAFGDDEEVLCERFEVIFWLEEDERGAESIKG